MKLKRSHNHVVIVPKGDPRAYPPTSLPVSPYPMLQKAPRVPKKPAQPLFPTSPATAPSVNVGAVLKAGAPAYSSAACSARSGSCVAQSTCGKQVVHGICPGPANIICCVPNSPPPPVANCLSNFNGATLASRALAYQQAYRSHGVTYSQPSRQFGASPPVQRADCSSFVNSVLDSLGWDCLFKSGQYTGAMNPIMVQRGGFHQVPKLGDIVMWSSHTGIIVQVCSGGLARMVAMGSHGAGDTGCISVNSMKGWGSGTWNGFWTPR